ncbi:MAG: hypothetical protein R2739_04455 [Chitinophagales bacterium]|nr:hypothetical protein [Bacteroidota bacterium]
MADSFFIRAARKGYQSIFGSYRENKIRDYFDIPILDKESGNNKIADCLSKQEPILICRLGAVETATICNYFEIKTFQQASPIQYLMKKIRGESNRWRQEVKYELEFNAGFFPISENNVEKFVELYLKIIPSIDILGIWYNYYEDVIVKEYCPTSKLVPLESIEPYFYKNPWSSTLKNKKILFVHPFQESIENQFKKREKLFDNKNVLPEFELRTIKAVQSNANCKSTFNTWFDALEYMKEQISKADFDIAIIGAGAYGLPLAAFVKSIGKQAVHMGGATQLMLGIKGNRWDNIPEINKLYNEHWVRPLPHETPKDYKIVEGGSYW